MDHLCPLTFNGSIASSFLSLAAAKFGPVAMSGNSYAKVRRWGVGPLLRVGCTMVIYCLPFVSVRIAREILGNTLIATSWLSTCPAPKHLAAVIL
jgi:hypothetical protein